MDLPLIIQACFMFTTALTKISATFPSAAPAPDKSAANPSLFCVLFILHIHSQVLP